MKLIKLSDVLEKHPEFTPKWKGIEEIVGDKKVLVGIDNPGFGRIEMWVHCKDDGSPAYDQPIITEGAADNEGKRKTASGAIVIPYYFTNNDDVKVGLIQQDRKVVKDPVSDASGYLSWELPRGFGKLSEASYLTATRELGEETSKVAKQVHRLGNAKAGVNANTAFYSTHITVWAAEVDLNIESHLKPDSKEPILKCDFLPYKQIRDMVYEGQIICGLSLAGLTLFDTFLEKQYGKPFR